MDLKQLLDLATQHLMQGNLAEARRLFAQVLAQQPDHPVALIRSGLVEMQDGHADLAVAPIKRATELAPRESGFFFVLGEVLSTLKRWTEAAEAYRRSVAIKPDLVDAHFALGRALQNNLDWAGASDAYRKAVSLEPNRADALNNLGNCRRMLADLPGAADAYRRVLQLRPDSAGTLSNLGTVLREAGNLDEALPLLQRAVELEPTSTGHAVNLGAALCDARQFARAEAVLRSTIAQDSASAEANYNLGNTLLAECRYREAAAHYRRAIELRPNHASALSNLGNALAAIGETKQALDAYRSAMRADPNMISAINNLACTLVTMERMDEAEALLRKALADHPGNGSLWNNLGNVLKEANESIACFRSAVRCNPNDAEAHSNLAYALAFQAEEQGPVLEECRLWNQRHALPLSAEIKPFSIAPRGDRRLRIGYVAPDFREHCQSFFTIPLLANHDRNSFEIHCYSSVVRPDQITHRIAGHVEHWHEVAALSDAELAKRIRADKIDLLVDLTMHMSHGRPLLFARRPAPVQVAWLAYPGTTGLSTMDYRLSDARLDPPGFESHYTERTIYLPDAFWCYDPLTDRPAVNPLPAIERGFVTFGCLNNPFKLSDRTFGLWARVMARLPEARLMLLAPRGTHRQRLTARLEAHGIAAARISFSAVVPRADYLKLYHQIDIGLDTLPYNGHTTSLDSFWMGVPVLTRMGNTCVGRGGVSQLYQLNLMELACETDEAFVEKAVELATDSGRVSQLRKELRRRLADSPLMDGPRFARNMERIFRDVNG